MFSDPVRALAVNSPRTPRAQPPVPADLDTLDEDEFEDATEEGGEATNPAAPPTEQRQEPPHLSQRDSSGDESPSPRSRRRDQDEIFESFFSSLSNSFADITTLLKRSQLNAPPPSSRARSNRSRLRDPDIFNGEDPAKLRPFLTQISLHLAERPQDFPTEDDKIVFVLSYLRGPALEWFDQDIGADVATVPYWDGDYRAFLGELEGNFGPHDPSGDAQDKIETCRMRSDERIPLYLVRFNQLAVLTGWDEAALSYRFYRGLPTRLKDDLSRVDYDSSSLLETRQAAQKLDARYWRREEERRREVATQQRSTATPTRPPAVRSSTSTNTSAPTPTTSRAADSLSKPYADKLGGNGKLQPDERTRRLKEGLCLYCGGKGHQSKDCRKRPSNSSSNSASARASDVVSVAEGSEN